MHDLLIINLVLLERFKNGFGNSYDKFRRVFQSSFNGYFRSCNDPVIIGMHKRLETLFTEIEKSYHNIDKWWDEYISNVERLEKCLSNDNRSGNITESTVEGIVHGKLPELRDYNMATAGTFDTKTVGSVDNGVFIDNSPEKVDNINSVFFIGFQGSGLVYSSPDNAQNGTNGISPYLPAYEGYKTYKVYNVATGASAEVHPGDNVGDVLASIGATSTDQVMVNIINSDGIPLAWQSLDNFIGNSEDVVIEEPPVKPVETVTQEPVYTEPEPVYEPEPTYQEPEPVYVPPVQEQSYSGSAQTVYFNCTTKTYDYIKANDCRNAYGDKITYYANLYGVDPNLAIAVATQESGYHDPNYNPKTYSTGLFQLRDEFIVGQTFSAYNLQTGNQDSVTVYANTIGDLDTNIQVACMILANHYEQFEGNILVAVEAYHIGPVAMISLIRRYCMDNGYETYNEAANAKSWELTETEKKVIRNYSDVEWIQKYVNNYVNNGNSEYDSSYITNVFQYIITDENGNRHIKFRNLDGSTNEINVIG